MFKFPERPEKGVEFPGIRVTQGGGMSHMSAGNLILVFLKCIRHS